MKFQQSIFFGEMIHLRYTFGQIFLCANISKNDRRNSGGTLRQKFNHIDLRHFTFNQWTNGTMDHWTNGPMDQWNNGPMDIRHSLVTLVTSIALILFKGLRVTLVTSIASMD